MKKINLCVVGLGYVGTPLLLELRKKGLNASGVDKDKQRIKNLQSCIDNHDEMDDESLKILSSIVFDDFELLNDTPNVYIELLCACCKRTCV